MEIELLAAGEEFPVFCNSGKAPTHAFPGEFCPENASMASLLPMQQQPLLIRDLKYVLVGQEGIYIRHSRSGGYAMSSGVDVRFRQSVEVVMGLGARFKQIAQFVAAFRHIKYGKTMGVLCFHMDALLGQFKEMVAMIGGDVNLASLIKDLQLYLGQFEQVGRICTAVEEEEKKREQPGKYNDIQFSHLIQSLKQDANEMLPDSTPMTNVKGGIVLNIIDNQIQSCIGDPRLESFLLALYHNVSQPFVSMLNKWLGSGVIEDPFEEFGIVAREQSTFTFRSDGLVFKDPAIQRLILLTGKYRGLSRDASNATFLTSLRSDDITMSLTMAFQQANESLCLTLRQKYNINVLIPEILNWYLIRGPVNKTFNEILMSLKKSVITQDTLAKLRLCYYSPSITYDALEFNLDSMSVIDELHKLIDIKAMDANEVLQSESMGALTSMFRAFTETQGKQPTGAATIANLRLTLSLPSPLNEIILESQQYELGLLFKYITLLSFLERRFDKSWREIGYSVYWTWGYSDLRIQKFIKRARIIHVKLFEFLRIYNHYVKFSVIETNFDIPQDITDLSAFNSKINTFLSSTLNDCLLTDKVVSSLVFSMIQLLVNFNEYILQLRKTLVKMDQIKLSTVVESPEWIDEHIGGINERLNTYTSMFESGLGQLVKELGQIGALDNGKVLYLRQSLELAFTL